MTVLHNPILGFILISTLFLTNCAENMPLNGLVRSKTTPHIEINDQGEPTIELLPVAPPYSKNSLINKLEEEIQKNRTKKVRMKLSKFKNEKITFSNPKVLFKNNGQKKVTLDVTHNGTLEPITFLAPKDHKKHFLFIKSSGFSKKIVTLQGMCLDNHEIICDKLVLEIAYFINELKVTAQFIVGNPNTANEPLVFNTEQKPEELNPEPITTSPKDPLTSKEELSKKELIFIKENNKDSLTQNPLPKSKDDSKNLNTPPHHEIDSESTTIGAGRFVLPNIDENKATAAFNINSAEIYNLLPHEQTSNNALLNEIQTTVFNQSKYFYAKYLSTHGKIKNAIQLPTNLNGSKINPNRRNKQYASGLLIKTLEYISKEFNHLYPNAPLCVNNLSTKKGGPLEKQMSHQNGLDADISFPSTANNCEQPNYFKSWTELDSLDNTFKQKNWEFLNILIATERVNIIFIDKAFINSLCTYVKNNTNATKTQRNKIFKKLRHENKHKNHYHIRMVCNFQNTECITQPLNGNITDCN